MNTTTDHQKIADAVERGATLLEQRGFDEKWRTVALSPDFDMSRPSKCILSGVFGGFHEGYHELGWGYDKKTAGGYQFDEVIRHGFFADDPYVYPVLTEAWKSLARVAATKDAGGPDYLLVAVQQGIERFKEVGCTVDWTKAVKKEDFDMGHPEKNLLTKLFGTHEEAYRILKLRDLHEAWELGFRGETTSECERLTKWWTHEGLKKSFDGQTP